MNRRPLYRLHRCLAAWFVLALTASASAQIFDQRSDRSSSAVGINNSNAPVPSPLLTAKRAFISYEIGDITAFPSDYSGGPERAYAEFYGQMKAWGRYQIVSNPRDADIIFAVRFVDPPNIVRPQIRVGIMDSHRARLAVGLRRRGQLRLLQETSRRRLYRHREAAD